MITKDEVFLNHKKVVDVQTEDILIAPSGSTEQTNDKKFVDSDGTVKSTELESIIERIKANYLHLKKEFSLWKKNVSLQKSHSNRTRR